MHRAAGLCLLVVTWLSVWPAAAVAQTAEPTIYSSQDGLLAFVCPRLARA